MLALSHCDGSIPSLRDFWNSMDRGREITSAIPLRSTRCHVSGLEVTKVVTAWAVSISRKISENFDVFFVIESSQVMDFTTN